MTHEQMLRTLSVEEFNHWRAFYMWEQREMQKATSGR